MGFKEIPMEVRNKALREAIRQIPLEVLRVVLADCELTEQELRSLLDHRAGADLTQIGGKMYVSDRTLDRRRASALNKLRTKLET